MNPQFHTVPGTVSWQNGDPLKLGRCHVKMGFIGEWGLDITLKAPILSEREAPFMRMGHPSDTLLVR